MKYSISVHNKNHPPNGRFPLFPTVAELIGRDDTYQCFIIQHHFYYHRKLQKHNSQVSHYLFANQQIVVF